MKRAVVFIFVACCAVSVLSLGEDKTKSKPPATVIPAAPFSPSAAPTITPAPNTTTPTTTPTTTITPAPNTTTPTTTPTTTITPAPNTTTATTTPTTTITPAPNTTTPTTTPTTTITPAPNTTTATTTPTTTITPAPNTTTATTTPTTTITPAPNTTTTTISPNTTTATTTPTTTPKTTAPPAPQPTPPVNVTLGNYNITKDKKVCLMAQMTLQIRLSTPNANGTFNVQPNKTRAEGYCMDAKANLTLVFKEGFITFMFNKSADQTAYVDALSFSVFYPLSKGVAVKGPYTASNKSMHLFPAKVKHSYSCKSESLFMGNGLYLDVSQDRMQAFNLTNNEFGSSDPCPADQPNYRAAIAVGVTLLVLIVIVVVAYLLSRRRRTDGYQSL